MADFTKKGLFRANPNADEDNNLRLVHADTPGTVQKDLASDIDTVTGSPANFTGIEYAGADGAANVINFSTPIAVTDYDGLKDAIFAITRKHEVDGIVTVTFSTPNVTVTHYGAGTLSKVFVDDAEEGTFARSNP